MKAERFVPLATTVFVIATAMAVLFVNPSAARETSVPSALESTTYHAIVIAPERLQAN